MTHGIAESAVAELPWSPAQFPAGQLTGIAIAPNGDVITLDRGGRQWADHALTTDVDAAVIGTWSPDGSVRRDGPTGQAMFGLPHAITCAGNDLWVTDCGRHQAFRLDAAGEVGCVLGKDRESGDGPDRFGMPTAVAVGADGRIFVTDGYLNARVSVFDPDGIFMYQFGAAGDGDGQFMLPHDLTIDVDETILVADRMNRRLQRFDAEGRHLETIDDAAIGNPFSVATIGNHIIVLDCGFPTEHRAALVIINKDSGRIQRFAESGTPRGLVGPHALAVGPFGIYVADMVLGVRRFELKEGP
ncbi:sugar lactone lactonase YvrE [Mycobacterium frederiksbergense]|uniref:Sugar lactone lactonase YvrE n=1 Tax=Mycolicibacterium frederiksbergense TaxID=117567 RepID=A0ABT6L1B2_9MYCO|nr:6-bladed beta-propeller [Mycolicibacterium frederiksbergense]MDH6196060.1 sugar lactone lactonase YvrE [Mycolicibacterium frederiksbergense]